MTIKRGHEQLYEDATCDYFTRGACHSCSLLAVTSGNRVEAKNRRLREILSRCDVSRAAIHSIIMPADPWQSRRKIKMSVAGTTESPRLGIIKSDLSTEDLSECPLTPDPIKRLLRELKELIRHFKLTPYSVAERRGELKQVIVMGDHALSSAIIRFVLRSTESVPRIKKCVTLIQQAFPWVRVVSCNIQPLAAAILDGPQEIVLTECSHIRERYGEVPLYLSPQSFMQVTPEIATQLYQYAANAAVGANFESALDLYCGAGGFSLHLSKHVRQVTGVELSVSAIDSAKKSAGEMGVSNATFVADSAEAFIARSKAINPDLILVNPPRRGLTEQVVSHLRVIKPSSIFYSSCNPETMARDIQAISDYYEVQTVQPFDMFPMTDHIEVFATLRLRNA